MSVTPLTSDLACLCHVRGFHQTTVSMAISFHGALVVDVQVGSPIFVYFSVLSNLCSLMLRQWLQRDGNMDCNGQQGRKLGEV